MKWTILSDNRSSDSRLSTEHGLSILLETERHKILLDTGASDVFIKNAEQLGIDLSDVDYVFISHGHSDHAGGLRYFLEYNRQAQVIVSPDAMSGKFFSKRGDLHSITTEWPEIDDDRLILIDQTCEIAEGLHAIAHIPQIHPMPIYYSRAVLIVVLRTFWQPVLGTFIPLLVVSTCSMVRRRTKNWWL